ncbi:P-loop containing nucleoside triphosphate hydrolase protein [Pavlovales sp. CCMP2436]|nr:P-loop containing nucleoside triphosphate hydrolase protein [Pavlovales sp. CCMP2436]
MSGLLASSACLDDEHAEALARCGIKTMSDVLFRSASACVPGVQIADAQRRLVERIGPVFTPLGAAWAQTKASACLVRTCTDLDRLLGGGLLTGEITELAGRSGSSKTWLCLSACAHAALALRASVLYVDMGKNFSARALLGATQRVARELDIPQEQVAPAMARVRVARANDCDEAVAALVHAHAHARTCTAPGIDAWYAKLGLVVVDCVALSLLPLMARDSAGHMWIQSVSRALRELARCNVAVLVTNILVAGDTPLCVGVIDTKAKLALGSSWRLVSDMRVILEPQRTTAAAGAGEYTSPPVCLSGLSVVAWLEKSTRMLRGESLVIHRPLAGPPGT